MTHRQYFQNQEEPRLATTGIGGDGVVTDPAALAVRGLGQLYDLQAAAARMMLQTQARAACALGMPDYSNFLDDADQWTKRFLSANLEQFRETAEQARQTCQEVQFEFGRLVECQAVHWALYLQQGLRELEALTEENLSQLRAFTRAGEHGTTSRETAASSVMPLFATDAFSRKS